MKITKNETNFEPCPEYTGRAVCVDVTPLRKQPSQFGERNVFKVVFEVERDRADGTRFSVWSHSFTPTLNEKANLRKFLRGWFGRDLTETELSEFDTETLVGKPANLVVVHEHKDGTIYANIAACTPDKSGNPLKPSGKFVRKKEQAGTGPAEQGNGNSGNGGGYRRSEQPTSSGAVDHSAIKVHVGRCAGHELRDLSADQITALAEKWLPTAKANPKPTADDKRLIAALDWFLARQTSEAANAANADNLQY